MKKYIFIFIFIAIFSGYQFGVRKNNDFTIEYMVKLQNQMNAVNSISQISDIGNIIPEFNNNQKLNCYAKKEIDRLVKELDKCSSDKSCQEKIGAHYNEKITEVINSSKKLICN